MNPTDKEIEDAIDNLAIAWYEDWRDNYITIDKFAEDKNMSKEGAAIVINDGKKLTHKKTN
tara:strand:- start:478 stop:660 length:183 start_codon:yes stop_codon:yes gene_type:complete